MFWKKCRMISLEYIIIKLWDRLLKFIYICTISFCRDWNTKTTLALVAVTAITAILFASALSDNAMACRRGGDHSVHQSSGQVCQNTNARCQNNNNQNSGDDSTNTVVGNQP
jgi:hypothetical protein